jgi:uncharacterized paraquat-inducible protein A
MTKDFSMPRDNDGDELDDDPDNNLADDEFPDEDDGGEDADTVPCPYCGEPVYEQAERCPRCENFLTREDAPLQTPLWIRVTVAVCLVLVLSWILFSW